MFQRRFRGSRALAALAIAASVPASATSVAPMSVPEMADHAAAVIVGEVSSVTSAWAGAPRTIESTITLREVVYLKGARGGDAGGTLTLTVPGGELDGFRMRIAGAPEFAVGETWVLFVLPQWRVHPVVGISAGAFRAEAAGKGGPLRVHQDGRPVIGLDDAGFIVTSAPGAAGPAPGAGGEPALALEEFLARIGPVVRASRGHRLDGPAGRRAAVDWTPVALRPAAAKKAGAK